MASSVAFSMLTPEIVVDFRISESGLISLELDVGGEIGSSVSLVGSGEVDGSVEVILEILFSFVY